MKQIFILIELLGIFNFWSPPIKSPETLTRKFITLDILGLVENCRLLGACYSLIWPKTPDFKSWFSIFISNISDLIDWKADLHVERVLSCKYENWLFLENRLV